MAELYKVELEDLIFLRLILKSFNPKLKEKRNVKCMKTQIVKTSFFISYERKIIETFCVALVRNRL